MIVSSVERSALGPKLPPWLGDRPLLREGVVTHDARVVETKLPPFKGGSGPRPRRYTPPVLVPPAHLGGGF
ncbi:hypothetical protein Val02_02390 [Virgisporangium aliadipatigenens]|uniref:Uncharacterized protein n=1 Tax=Virgisporangium aliadipatigenens TaxID=741659 RepID=A0A8J3YFK2_9ACTN|nr:hypothetical protein [Virgisporangium aliadipatigenens]GIJ43353.1 hypothetical protein Val02_02390 [Virgisporangium aliadipatigenens]